MGTVVKQYSSEYFDAKSTLECGQVFRFSPYKKGYLVISQNKACYLYTENETTILECDVLDLEYFEKYFDISTDYSLIVKSLLQKEVGILTESVNEGKGIRILKQNLQEVIISFIISQNNNITKIKNSIEYVSKKLGEVIETPFGKINAFPTAESIIKGGVELLKEAKLGYRAEYVYGVAQQIENGLIESLINSKTQKEALLNIKGVGEKVANCILLFGLQNFNSFPVDTWLIKVCKEDFKKDYKSAKSITKYFEAEFKGLSGYAQQYLFYNKRSKSKKRS